MIHCDCESKFKPFLEAAASGDWHSELTEAIKKAPLKTTTEAIDYFSQAKRQLGFCFGNSQKQMLSYYFSRVITLCKRHANIH